MASGQRSGKPPAGNAFQPVDKVGRAVHYWSSKPDKRFRPAGGGTLDQELQLPALSPRVEAEVVARMLSRDREAWAESRRR